MEMLFVPMVGQGRVRFRWQSVGTWIEHRGEQSVSEDEAKPFPESVSEFEH